MLKHLSRYSTFFSLVISIFAFLRNATLATVAKGLWTLSRPVMGLTMKSTAKDATPKRLAPKATVLEAGLDFSSVLTRKSNIDFFSFCLEIKRVHLHLQGCSDQ